MLPIVLCTQGAMQDCQLLRGKSDICSSTFSAIIYVHFRKSKEGKSASGVGNPCAPHPLNKSLCLCILISRPYTFDVVTGYVNKDQILIHVIKHSQYLI